MLFVYIAVLGAITIAMIFLIPRVAQEVQQLIYDDPPGVVAYVLHDYTASRKSVVNYGIHPLWGVLYLDDVWLNK